MYILTKKANKQKYHTQPVDLLPTTVKTKWINRTKRSNQIDYRNKKESDSPKQKLHTIKYNIITYWKLTRLHLRLHRRTRSIYFGDSPLPK